MDIFYPRRPGKVKPVDRIIKKNIKYGLFRRWGDKGGDSEKPDSSLKLL
jgi:hypothetical protein